ncbi:MAG TPA: VWA domain-containing protein [Maribacter sp.]|uniref:vWA domain-containing protein n=1 Tax=unclassified Maribacter TaxID=2615042 RepID=UPI000EC0FBE9|nr:MULTISPECIES: von Willebrand factor type A domain-containing protein [unclassified Maribacter]HAI37343.1 VWA domain-containing protein [Maribacter sp.]|tara:strand:- start:80983 stop:83064 length:2082 start_codon:yes stop_codon:yes gene_type:complete
MKNVIFLFFLLNSVLLLSQQIKISGTVSDNKGNPLPGANVIEKGTTNSTQTDFEGHYSLIVSKGAKLVFSYIGCKNFIVRVKDETVIDVSLEEDFQALEEVVVVGYGIQKRSHVTGSVSMINIQRPKNSISRALQGKVSGVQIRGIGTVESKKEGVKVKTPLYIVDGVPIQKEYNAIIQSLKNEDINSRKELNAAEAKSLYGKDARYGCIVIRTVHGNYNIENDENYAKITENQFQNVTINPLSTFSIDVDKAAYSNIRRFINKGQDVPVSAVKIEEMVNYFDYDYAQPKNEHPFSVHTEVAKTPWNVDTKLVRIGLQGKEYLNEDLPASNLTFLIDVSGSMSADNKLPLLKSAFKLLVNQLRDKDRISIVVYAGAAGVVLEPTSGSDKTKIINALNNLEAGGSTAGGQGIELAYQLAEKHFKKNGNNRVILATDGDFNIGLSSDYDMENLIVKKRESGVFLSVLGFGIGNYKDSKLETLADKGNGNHAYIDTMQEAQKVFGKEFGGTLFTIAKDVKLQVEFNPNKVKSYRLLGYENRLLADEDFIDDTKDAGELGSGHKVTALYEIVEAGVKTIYDKDIPKLKYASNTNENTFLDELFTVRIRYKKPDGKKSLELVHVQNVDSQEMSEDFQFSAAVALFGQQLRKSKFTNKTTYKDVIVLAEKGRGKDVNGYRAEFIRLVKSANDKLVANGY